MDLLWRFLLGASRQRFASVADWLCVGQSSCLVWVAIGPDRAAASSGQRRIDCERECSGSDERNPGSQVVVYTIGHSTRSLAEFGVLLQEASVQVLVDVRAMPNSRTNPQFNIEGLPSWLMEIGVDYRHIVELGGRRHRARDAPPSPNTFWQHQSFRNYADYAATDSFKQGITTLVELARRRCCAIMCSEALWWRCHRRIIGDYLLAQGAEVRHILGRHKVEPATLTSNARQLSDGTLVYPA